MQNKTVSTVDTFYRFFKNFLDSEQEDKRQWTWNSNRTWLERIWICFTEYSALLSQIFPL